MNAIVSWLEQTLEVIPLPLLEVWGRVSYILGFVLMIYAFGGFTFRPGGRWRLGREHQAWDLKAFLSIPVTFVMIIVTGYIGSFIVLVPGAQTFESLKDLVVFLCIMLFGYPALITVPFAYGLSDLIEGIPPAFLLDWLPGYFINPTCFWIAYQFFGKNPDFRRGRTWLGYLGFVLIFLTIEPVMWGYICADKFTTAISFRTVTPALFFTTSVTWLLAPLVMLGALPLARRFGLFWAEIPGHVQERLWNRPEWIWRSGARENQPVPDPAESSVPIRMLILTPFIVLVLLMVGATAYVTLRSASEDANKLATRLHEEIAQNINLYLDDELARTNGASDTRQAAAITSLLEKLPIAGHGRAFIINRSGRVVASSVRADDPVIASAIAAMTPPSGSLQDPLSDRQFRFVQVTAKPLSRETWLAQAWPYQDQGGGHADWIVVTAMPEAYYLAGIRTGNSRSAMIFSLALLLSLTVAAVLASMVTAPLRRISSATRALAQGDLSQQLPDSNLVEVSVLTRSFNHMAGRLKQTFDDLNNEVAMRKEAEQKVRALNRTYAMLSEINHLLVRKDRPEIILDQACHIALERGGFLLAWIGLNDPVIGKLQLVAHAGATPDTLEVLHEIFSNPAKGCQFTAQALSSGLTAVANDIEHDPRCAAWRELALQRGYRSMVSLPLIDAGKPVGTFNLYAPTPAFFNAEEIDLLAGLAANLSFAREMARHEAERLAAESALRTSEERFRELAETIDEVFWISDPVRKQILYVSPAYERIWDRSCQSLYDEPHSWLDSAHPDDRERMQQVSTYERQLTETYDEEFRIIRPDKSERWIRARTIPVRDAAGLTTRIVGVARDITEQRTLAERLHQSQKMEALGQLAGGVAHDFNNILAAVMMQSELLLKFDSTSPEDFRRGLENIRLCAERAANLTRQMLLFSRKQVMQLRALDLNESVTRLATMLHRIIGEDVQLQVRLHPTALVTRADEGMIDQLLMNLTLNARDAMPQGGLLLIETAAKTLDAHLAQQYPEARPGNFVWLSVSDTGAGMGPEVLSRLFEPFFTTKGPGKGTGLGLATVFGIVKQHKGWIRVYSELGKGTNFQVFLPEAATGAVASAPELEPAVPTGNNETILLVEDDADVRLMTRTVLALNGYNVLETGDGLAALEVWRQRRDEIDLVLTDLIMPGGLNGKDLARQLQGEDPQLKVIYASGYSAEIAGKELKLCNGENFLQKPYPSDQLLRCVHASLHSRADA